MSAPELTKEEVEVLRDRTQRTLARCLEYPYKDWDGGRVKELVEEQLSLLATLDAVQRERDHWQREFHSVVRERDADRDHLTAQVQALEGERDALRLQVQDLTNKLVEVTRGLPSTTLGKLPELEFAYPIEAPTSGEEG